MFNRASRYAKGKAFIYDTGEAEVFKGVRPRQIGKATGVIEHRLRSWERLDQLAQHYYNDPRKWWRIVDANPELLFSGELSGDVAAGMVILIPRVEETAE